MVEARKLEMAWFKKMGVYSQVSRSEVKAKGGRFIPTRWVDTNKGDDNGPNYRSRLVDREVRIDSRLDLFAPPPPLEAMKFQISVCARGQNRSQNRRLRMMTIDVRRACFYAPAQCEVCIEIPVEDREAGDEGMVGKLNLSLYGTHDAALNWTKEYTRALEEIGFVKGKASACNFRHVQRDVKLPVHGDDFLVTGWRSDLLWLRDKLGSKCEIKTHLLGPEDEQEINILNRVTRWSLHGLEYEADQRHAELVIKELGLLAVKPVSTLTYH